MGRGNEAEEQDDWQECLAVVHGPHDLSVETQKGDERGTKDDQSGQKEETERERKRASRWAEAGNEAVPPLAGARQSQSGANILEGKPVVRTLQHHGH